MRKSRDKEIGYTANQATYKIEDKRDHFYFEIVKFIFTYVDVPYSPYYCEACSFARVSDTFEHKKMDKKINELLCSRGVLIWTYACFLLV